MNLTENELKEQDGIAYIEEMPVKTVQVFQATKEHLPLAGEIATMYEAALGKGGLRAEGMEPYPDSDLFSEAGVQATLEAGERTLAIARIKDGKEDCLAGAMVMDRLSPHHVEFNSMAVRLDKRGRHIGTAIVEGLKQIVEETEFTVNATELVTHSLASQAAHFHNGYKNICGFSFCHYPRVFFKNHPESVLWVMLLQGKLIPLMRRFRSILGRELGSTPEEVTARILEAQAGLAGSKSGNFKRLSEREMEIAADVLSKREVHVPPAYRHIVQSILFQFEDILDREIVEPVPLATMKKPGYEEEADDQNPENPKGSEVEKAGVEKAAEDKQEQHGAVSKEDFEVDPKEGFGHAYIICKPNFRFDETSMAEALTKLQEAGKRFILVRMPSFNSQTLDLSKYLKSRGFVFQSYLPLYGHFPEAKIEFQDILTMQWIKPEVLAENALPGETESVVKLYGYPENLSGEIVKLIARELAEEVKN
ncbi:MAG: hypothetical protein HY986_18010 [Candidatus Melainabacteria bacterium]|nr:hypothetical protein [Candidatus Melainabacteria bacterium]